MAWRAITEADLLQRISGDELEALRAAALGTTQEDPVASHIDQTTELVRGYIGACSQNTLGPEGTLPERLILPACDLLVVDVGSRVAGMLIDLNETRKEARKAAVRLLENVAACRFAIEKPETAGEDSPSPPGPSMYTRAKQFTRADQDGI